MTIPQWLSPVLSKYLFAILISLLLSACSTEENFADSTTTQDVILAWVAPVEREDGTPISMAEIAGYRVYYGMSEGDYTNQVDISDSGTMQATLNDIATGTYYIVVTTYDMDGRESAYSSVVTATI